VRATLIPNDSNFRRVIGHFATGVAVVTAIDDGPVGFTVQALCALSLNPPLILVCAGRASTTWPHVAATGRLCVNLLSDEQAQLARQFAVSGGDKYVGVGWAPSEGLGLPVIDGSLAWIDCEIVQVMEGGDHWIAVCRVLALEAFEEMRPLIFSRGEFGTVAPIRQRQRRRQFKGAIPGG
jgi:3-hydroxy-9,10-secoandrosta-1,3,5(10)-triene-9,17-dione monooxygenase reductase component